MTIDLWYSFGADPSGGSPCPTSEAAPQRPSWARNRADISGASARDNRNPEAEPERSTQACGSEAPEATSVACATNGGSSARLSYNALGQRVQKAVTGSLNYTYQSYYSAFGGRQYDYNAANPNSNVVDYYFPGDLVKYINDRNTYVEDDV